MGIPEFDNTVPGVEDLVVTPDEADAFVSRIRGPDGVSVVDHAQRGGRTAYRITLGSPGRPHVFFTRPHAHEPVGTAACFEWVRRLTRDRGCAWASAVRERFRLSFLADANPSGSQRAPVKFWDGSVHPNEVFFLWMFGESGEAEGERFPRVAAWDDREVTPPRLLGIAYEQLDDHVYVEPNRDHRSTFFRSYFDLHADEPVDVWLDLHQTEYVGSDRNSHMNLPTNIDDLPTALRDHYTALATAILDRWRAEGAFPRDEPQRTYRNNPTQYAFLNAVWSSVTPQTLHLVTEVQNNNPRTPVEDQVRFQMTAMDQTLRYVDGAGDSLKAALEVSRAGGAT